MERYCRQCGCIKEFNEELHQALKETHTGNGLGYGKDVGFISAHKCYDCHKQYAHERYQEKQERKYRPKGFGLSIAQRITLNFPVSPTEIENVKSGKWTLDHITYMPKNYIPDPDPDPDMTPTKEDAP